MVEHVGGGLGRNEEEGGGREIPLDSADERGM